MTILAYIISTALILIGFAGSVVPGLPGSPLIVLGALLIGIVSDFSVLSVQTIVILAVLSAVSVIVQQFASVYGAKKSGASSWGIGGAIIGGIAGLLIGNIFGFILGPFFGAVVGELLNGKSPHASVKSGIGATAGFLGGSVMQFTIALIMFVIIIAGLIW